MPIIEHKIDLPLPNSFNCQGIYAIKSLTSKKLYVGSSVNIKSRILQHINLLNKVEGEHHSKFLQRAWNKYKQSDFVAIILEKILEQEDLIIREQYWIDKFNSFHNGFNARPKAEANYGMIWSDEQNNARRISNKKTWEGSALRQNLSDKFKGNIRGVWSVDSHEKASATLKKRHADNPNWRENSLKVLNTPENLVKRGKGIRDSLKNSDVYNNRIKQLKVASEGENRIENLRLAYFKSHHLEKLGISTIKEFEDQCIELYEQGYSCRKIGVKFNIDHKSISNHLRRLGINIEKRYDTGSKNHSSKLDEEKVRIIKDQINKGYSLSNIARTFGVHSVTISDIKSGKTWQQV